MKNVLKLSLLFLMPLFLTGCFEKDEEITPEATTVDYSIQVESNASFANALYDCMLNALDYEYNVKYSLISTTSDLTYSTSWTRNWDGTIDGKFEANNIKVGSYYSQVEISFDGKTSTIKSSPFEITESSDGSTRTFSLTSFTCPN